MTAASAEPKCMPVPTEQLERATPGLVPAGTVGSAASELDPIAAQICHELAMKRYDSVERAYDAHNARAGAVFGFSSFLIAGLAASLRPLEEMPQVQLGVVALFGILYVVVAYSARESLRSPPVDSLPSASRILAESAAVAPHQLLRAQLTANIEASVARNQALVHRKTRHLQRALSSVFAQVVVIVVALLLGAVTALLRDT